MKKLLALVLVFAMTFGTFSGVVSAETEDFKYSAEDPFVFPSELNASATMEAEYATLNNSGGDSETWKLGVEEADWASNGKFVNCLNSGDSITIPYRADVAGTYTATITYRSGSTANYLNWYSENDMITAGTASAGNDDSSVTKTAEFQLVVVTAGAGVLTFNPVTADSPQFDKLDIVLTEITETEETEFKYSAEDPFVFPNELSASATMEAEYATLNNSGGDDETWKLGVEEADWASNGKFINCLNSGDSITIPYRADVAGTYTATITYRSGSAANYLNWYSENDMITAGTASAGNDDSSVTKTTEFQLIVVTAGAGVLTFNPVTADSPQFDKLDIVLTEVAVEVTKDALKEAIDTAKEIVADNYTAESYAGLTAAITAAETVYADEAATQDAVDEAESAIDAAVAALELKKVGTFEDVYGSDFYYEAVEWAHSEGVVNGKSETSFAPSDYGTRGDVVTFLWRAAGCPEPTSTESPFEDVVGYEYYYKAVLWAVETGIANGTSETRFSPNVECTRAQAVTFLWRAAGSAAVDAEESFEDVEEYAFYYDAVCWAVSEGITEGKKATVFDPDGVCTRGEIVEFLYRAK